MYGKYDNIYKEYTFTLFDVLCNYICRLSDDDNVELTPLPEGQGEVTFKFVRNKVYTISTLEDMARLKVNFRKRWAEGYTSDY